MQGERATLSCQVDANPPVKSIRWLRDGHSISNQFNFTIHELKISDAGFYSCQADNGIAPTLAHLASQQASSSGSVSGQGGASSLGGSSSFFSFLGFSPTSGGSSASGSAGGQLDKTTVEARLHVEILYAPRVQVRESRSMPLNEGDYFAINCSADSWPPAHEFIWMRSEQQPDGQTVLRRLSATNNSPTLEFNSISATDMANYTCTAVNRLEPSPINGISQILERQGSASFMVLVRHKPGLAEISAGVNGETELGNRTQIQCRAKPPGYPEPQYKFWKYQSNSMMSQMSKLYLNKQSHGPVYQIYSAKAEDEARYGCLATNELGQSNEAAAELIVNEAPSIIVEQTRREEDSRAPGESPYSITVRASGKPEPRVAWFHRSPMDGRRIDLSSAEMMSRFKIDTLSSKVPSGASSSGSRPKYSVVSTLTFRRPLEVDDRGLYTVEFSNGLSRIATDEFQLHINHAPIPALKNQPIVRQSHNLATSKSPMPPITRTRAGANLGETVNLTCRVSAHPQPQFVWYGGTMSTLNGEDKPIDNNPRYRTLITNPRDDIWEGTLNFEVSSESDYGDYMCVTANHDVQSQAISDSIQILISLGHKSAPEAPQQVEQIDATQDSITLQWVPGFDGGLTPNHFVVQYSPELEAAQEGSLLSKLTSSSSSQPDPSTANSLNDNQNNNSNEQYPKLFDCFSMNPCIINQLLPRQAYMMRVRARNELGFSQFSDEIRATTRANDTESLPRIQDASFDSSQGILQLHLEANQPDYLLNNLNVRIEAHSIPFVGNDLQPVAQPVDQQQQRQQHPEAQQQTGLSMEHWKHHSTVPMRLERGNAYLTISPQWDNQVIDQLRLSLCSRTQENLCGPEFVFGLRSTASSSLAEQVRGLSWPIIVLCLITILLFGFLATSINSCCLSRARRKAKKVAASVADAVDHHVQQHHHHQQRSTNGGVDNKYTTANGQQTMANGSHKGSTTSTNSTNIVSNNQINSLDSLTAGGQAPPNGFLMGANGSDQSSDHSRQAKLDSMLPPNYSHYADQASLMLEQQQQQQQQQMMYQQQSAAEKMGSPFGLPNSALFGQQVVDPFGHYGTTGGSAGGQQQFEQQLDAQSLVLNSMLATGGPLDPTGSGAQMQEAIWGGPQSGLDMDGYNQSSYNSFANQAQHQMIESAYGTTQKQHNNALIMAQQSAFDNSTNQQAFQQQPDNISNSYHQEIQAAQQQMYGTLTRQSSNQFANNASYSQHTNDSSLDHQSSSDMTDPMQQQQQQHEAYMSTNGLMPPPPPPPPPQESDYGTTGGRGAGRLIREIIV